MYESERLIREKLLATGKCYAWWDNPDSGLGFPLYDVLMFTLDQETGLCSCFRQDKDTGEWELNQPPFEFETTNFGRMHEIVEEEDVPAKLAKALKWNREEYGADWNW